MNEQHELPFLAGIAGVLRWIEELASIVSGPLLTFGLGIALVDLLTDGALLTSQPALLYAWAVSQAVGVDAQLVGAWDKARLALRSRRYWSLVGLLILGLALAYVGYLAAIVFAMQQSAGITTAQALARLGMDNATWLVSRAALSVVLVCLSGWTRYHPPAASSMEEEAAKLQRELTLEPLRAQVRARKALGWRDVGRSIIQGDAPGPSGGHPGPVYDGAQPASVPPTTTEPSIAPEGVQRDAGNESDPSEPPDDTPPTGPGSPSRKRGRPGVRTPVPDEPGILHLATPPEWRKTAARGRAKGSYRRGVRPRTSPAASTSVEEQVRSVWRPGMTVGQLKMAANVSRTAASTWRRVLKAEEDAANISVQTSAPSETRAAQ